jgi:hypothetical protein
MSLRPLPPPLKFRPQKAEEEPLDLEATAYNAKGKATDFGEEFTVSSFLVPHSSAYTKTYVLIDIFSLLVAVRILSNPRNLN